jgi:hypothetical protein
MSYDIRICVKTTEKNNYGENLAVVHVPEYDSPTYNLRPIFTKSMGWNYTQGVPYPLPDVLRRLKRGLKELAEHPDKYRALEPENRWGTVESAIECIDSWIDEIEDTLTGPTREWPIETLWWRW